MYSSTFFMLLTGCGVVYILYNWGLNIIESKYNRDYTVQLLHDIIYEHDKKKNNLKTKNSPILHSGDGHNILIFGPVNLK